MKQGIIMRSPTENSPTTCTQASAPEPEADAAPEAPAVSSVAASDHNPNPIRTA